MGSDQQLVTDGMETYGAFRWLRSGPRSGPRAPVLIQWWPWLSCLSCLSFTHGVFLDPPWLHNPWNEAGSLLSLLRCLSALTSAAGDGDDWYRMAYWVDHNKNPMRNPLGKVSLDTFWDQKSNARIAFIYSKCLFMSSNDAFQHMAVVFSLSSQEIPIGFMIICRQKIGIKWTCILCRFRYFFKTKIK